MEGREGVAAAGDGTATTDVAHAAAVSAAEPRPATTDVVRTRRITGLDVVTVGVIVVLSLAFARPLLEEWGLSNYWQANGLGNYATLAGQFPLRPLQVVPSALAWLFGHGSTLGFALSFALVMLAKYVAMRWAVGPFLAPRAAWFAAVLATVLIPWSAAWRMRYSGADLAAALVFLSLGALLRNGDRLRLGWTMLGALGVALALASYQGPALAGLALPLVVVAGRPARDARPGASPWRRLVVAAVPVAIGGVVYGVYSFLVVKLHGSAGYEGLLAGDGSTSVLSPSALVDAVEAMYRTDVVHAPWTLPLLIGLLVAVAGPLLGEVAPGVQLRWVIGLGVAVALLPLLASVYAVRLGFLDDPDRAGFPMAVGFVLVVTTVLLRFAAPGDVARHGPYVRFILPALVAALLVWTLVLGNDNRDDYKIQATVVAQTVGALARAHASSVVVADRTGRLGDVYLLYQSAFQQALIARGAKITSARLCTPVGVDRYLPDAAALHIATTPRCETLPATSPAPLRLHVLAVPGKGLRVLPGR